MRIILDRNLFAPKSKYEAVALVDLLSTAIRDSYNPILLTNPLYAPGADNAEIDAWLSGRLNYEEEAFRGLLTNGILASAGPRGTGGSDPAQPRSWHLPGPLEINVERRTVSDWPLRALTLADASDLLREPVHLVLENARTELAFLRHLAGPTNGLTLRTLVEQPGRIQTHGGGSGEAKKWIDALVNGGRTSEQWRRMLRAWILFDRDAGDVDALVPSKGAVDLMNACERVVSAFGTGLSWICLHRRTLESYVPDTGLRTEANSGQLGFVNQIIDWRNDHALKTWAWAVNIKKGLYGDLHSGLSKDDIREIKDGKKSLEALMLKSPFSGLSQLQIDILSRGLGDSLGKALRGEFDPIWVSDFPAEYDRGPAGQAPRSSFVQSLLDRM